MKRLLLVVCLFSLPAQLLAQQGATPVLNGFQFVAPMQIAVGTDDNFLVDRTNPNEKLLVLSLPPSIQPGAPDIRPKVLDDKFILLRAPKVALRNDSRRHEFIATWVPEFEIYKANPDQNGLSQRAMASFNYYLRRNLQIWVSDSFQTSKDPARALGNVLLLLPRSGYRENGISGSLEFQPSQRTNIGIQYDTTRSEFGQTDPFQARILDSTARGYAFSVSRMLGRNQRISARYSLFKITPINQRKRYDDAVDRPHSFENPINSFTMQYRVKENANTVLGFSGGLIKLQNGLNYTIGGNVSRRVGNFWPSVGYTRELAFESRSVNGLAQGLDSAGFYEVIWIRFRGQPTRNTGLLFDTTMSRSVASSLVDSRKAFMGRFRFDYRLSDRNVVFTSFESFQQNKNAYVLTPLTRSRFTVGIEISFSSDSDRRNSRLNEDAQYVALTDHGVRRQPAEED